MVVDSFEWNKIAAAGLIGVLLFVVVKIVPEFFFEADHEVISGPDEIATTASTEPVDAGPSIEMLINAAAQNPSNRAFRKCQACHDATNGGPNKIGPNLWNALGGTPGSKAGYSYSDAMAGKGGTWDYNDMNAFLTSPSTAVPGTKMAFAGIRTAEERAAIIAFLRASADNPVPLPDVPVSEEAPDDSQAAGE